MILPLVDRPPSDEETFARQAERAGLVLPRARPLDLRWAVAVVLAVLAVTVGVGQSVGWAVGPSSEHASVTIYGPQNCVGAPADVSAYLPGVVGSDSGNGWARVLAGLGSSFSNWSGGCVHVEVAVSSGDGYRPELSDRQSLFVAGTSTPTPLDRSALPQAAVVIPGALDTVEIIYDLPGISTPLRLSGSVLAGIYLGTISSWSDPRITSLNPGVDLSGAPPITPVYRDDAAPVNQAVTTFLAAANSSWASSIGSGPAVAWPAGVAASGPAAMASEVAAEPGAVGYLESVLSTPVGVQVASLQSAEGAFVLPTPTNATSAAAALASSPPFTSQDWANASVVDAPGTGSYPLVELAYTTMYKDPGTAYGGNLSRTNATWLLSFLWWMVTNASTVAPALGLAPLPEALVVLAQQDLENVTYDGSPVLEAEEPGGGETGEF